MTEIERTLEAERRIINAATAGPWRADHSRDYESDVYAVFHNGDTPDQDLITTIPKPFMRDVGPDAEFIALARTALPLRNAQVAAVLELAESNYTDDAATTEELAMNWICDNIRRAIEEAGA